MTPTDKPSPGQSPETAESPGTAKRLLEWGSLYLGPHRYATVLSDGRWKPYRWLVYLGAAINRCILKPRGRLVVNAPPRMGKSNLICHWTPTWYLDLYPHHRVMLAMYGQDVAEDWGRAVRDELNYNPLCSTKLKDDSTAAGRWHTREGGGMLAVGVGGPVTGRGGHLLIVDDPIKNAREANSPTYRADLVDWFQSTFYTRAEPDASIILTMARWHEHDLSGWLERDHEDDWEVIKMPALYVGPEPCPIGREPGDPLCPERYDRAAMLAIEGAVGERTWAAGYQQEPIEVGSGRLYKSYRPERNRSDRVRLVRDLPLQLSLDFNINPGMHGLVGQYDDRGSSDLLTAVYELHGPRMDVDGLMTAFAALIERLGGWQWPELHVFGDATGATEWVGTSESCYTIVIRHLRRLGVPYRRRVPKSNPPVRDSIDAFNDALYDLDGRAHYVAHPRCERLLIDLGRLRSDDEGLIDKSERRMSHASDAERYRVWYLRPLRSRSETSRGRFSVGSRA